MLATRCFSRVPRVFQRNYATNSYEIKTTYNEDGSRTSVLENGVKIVQIPRDDASVALGLFVDVGSVNETHQTNGYSHFVRRFLYKGTNKTTGLRMTRSIENLTTNFEALNGRETLVYKATTLPDTVPETAEIMANLLRPRFAEWEWRDVKELVKEDVEARKSNMVESVGDKIRHVAFKGVGIGRSPSCPEYNLNQIYPDQLIDWVNSNYFGDRVTLVVVGNSPVEDEPLLKEMAVIFGALPNKSTGSAEAAPVVASNYTGGELLEAGSSNIYVEAYKGFATNSKEYAAQLVLANILGDATSEFLPGNNITSRFAKEFSGPEFNLVSSFNTYDSQTLFGVRAAGNVSAKVLGEKVHAQLAKLGSTKVTAEELDRSRSIVKGRVASFLDSRYGIATAQKKWGNGAQNLYAAFDALTPESLQKVASEILSTPRSTYVKGDLTELPSFK